jgi:hypothetical protein
MVQKVSKGDIVNGSTLEPGKRASGRQCSDGNPRSDANHDTQSNASNEQDALAHVNSPLHSVDWSILSPSRRKSLPYFDKGEPVRRAHP